MNIFSRFKTTAHKEDVLQHGLSSYDDWLEKQKQQDETDSTSDDFVAQRRQVCEACEHINRRANYLGSRLDISSCSICGCFIKTKTLIRRARCPKGKW